VFIIFHHFSSPPNVKARSLARSTLSTQRTPNETKKGNAPKNAALGFVFGPGFGLYSGFEKPTGFYGLDQEQDRKIWLYRRRGLFDNFIK
jgi:hypothetical protein